MRTMADKQLDIEKFTTGAKQDPRTPDGARAILGTKEGMMLGKQMIARIYRNGMVPFVAGQSHIIRSLETLGLIEREELPNKTTALKLTEAGMTHASRGKRNG